MRSLSSRISGFNTTPLVQWAFRCLEPCLSSHEASTLPARMREFHEPVTPLADIKTLVACLPVGVVVA